MQDNYHLMSIIIRTFSFFFLCLITINKTSFTTHCQIISTCNNPKYKPDSYYLEQVPIDIYHCQEELLEIGTYPPCKNYLNLACALPSQCYEVHAPKP